MPNDTVNLEKAKRAKKDEFYTQYQTIEEELKHYSPSLFEGKTVFCNCDDPYVSQFFLYFANNFQRLGIKELISTCYKNQDIYLFNQGRKRRRHAASIRYKGERNEDGTIKVDKDNVVYLKGDGDFRSEECIALLQQSDIVVTNPPFSLFREFIKLLVDNQKKFLIIGNINAITYKECFKLFEKGEMWIGCSIHSGDREFNVPRTYSLDMKGARTLKNGDIRTKTGRIDVNGNKYVRVKGIRWFTNLEYTERHIPLKLTAKYNPEDYPTFDNIPQAINVDKTALIPSDYNGIMGVPISFVDKYCPEQFKIIGNEYTLKIENGRGYINGKRKYGRIFIQKIQK